MAPWEEKHLSRILEILELIESFKGLRRIHHAGAGAHINRHPHGLQHFLPARPLLHGGFGMEGDAGRSDGDADGDADVDGHDFLMWQQQVGSSQLGVGASAAVPATSAIRTGEFARQFVYNICNF